MSYLLLLCVGLVHANVEPKFEFSMEIKTPQLIGIIFGCIVFFVTISSVIYLLFQSGSWGRFVEEIQSGKPMPVNAAAASSNDKSKFTKALKDYPKLYDNLVEASKKLPIVLDKVRIESNRMIVRTINTREAAASEVAVIGLKSKKNERKGDDITDLVQASNGEALYHESSYDPMRLWMWHPQCKVISNPNAVVPSTVDEVPKMSDDRIIHPAVNVDSFHEYIQDAAAANITLLCIVDREFGSPVGMMEIVNNSPRNLTVQIDNLWLTPAYHGKKFSYEAMLLILVHLFTTLQYRRITYEIDPRNLIGKRFLIKCGFKLECTLSKHRIVQERNRDSCVYVMLNSEWPEIETYLRKMCDIPAQQIKLHNIAEIDTIEEIVESINLQKKAYEEEQKEGLNKKISKKKTIKK